MTRGAIEIVDPNDKGLPADLRFEALSNKTLAYELDRFLVRHADKWKLNGDEQGLLGAVAARLLSYS